MDAAKRGRAPFLRIAAKRSPAPFSRSGRQRREADDAMARHAAEAAIQRVLAGVFRLHRVELSVVRAPNGRGDGLRVADVRSTSRGPRQRNVAVGARAMQKSFIQQ